MNDKIHIEWMIMEDVLNNLPTTEAENNFRQKYIEPNNNFEIEDDMRDVLFAVDRQSFLAGFRSAMALVQGKTNIDIAELIRPCTRDL